MLATASRLNSIRRSRVDLFSNRYPYGVASVTRLLLHQPCTIPDREFIRSIHVNIRERAVNSPTRMDSNIQDRDVIRSALGRFQPFEMPNCNSAFPLFGGGNHLVASETCALSVSPRHDAVFTSPQQSHNATRFGPPGDSIYLRLICQPVIHDHSFFGIAPRIRILIATIQNRQTLSSKGCVRRACFRAQVPTPITAVRSDRVYVSIFALVRGVLAVSGR